MTINYLGKYDNLSLLWEAHPNGGIEGEYCYVGDQLFVWDKYENDWVEGSAEALDVVPSEQPERESNNGLNCIGCFESEQQLWSQHPQGGVEGDYVVIAGKEYIWDKYNKEWREATEEDAAHFTAVIVQDEAYEYSRLAITFMGSFEDVSQIWKVYPQGGIEGGYIYLGEDKYIWDKYSYSWKPFEPTESSKLRPIDVTYTEGVVAYSEDYINYIGTFDNLDQVWEMYPNGGKDGDYILVNGERLKWNKYTSNWGEDESGDTSPARSVATIYGDLHVFNDLVIGEGLYARILEELSKKQWVQDNFTTKQWLLDQNYARQEWVLDQYKVLQDWVDQRNADIAKWILERNYISEGDISSETVMNLIETDEITITKKDGVLVAIASGGQGGTVLEPVNFEKGIRIGGKDGIEIIYDIENNALCFGGNAYSLGGMTAGGVGSGGSGGGGGISYNRLDSWSDYSVDKAGYVLSALLGSDLNTRLSSIENAGYITQSALAPYALRSEIPSLEGYATLDALNTLSQTVVNFKSLFDSMFEKDSDGNIHAKLSLWSSGGITAGGVGSGGSGGGGGVSYNRLDSWADYSADKAGYVLSAALGYDMNTRLTSVENAGYVTASALAPYVLRSEVEGQYLSKNGGTMVNGAGIFNEADPGTVYGAIGFNSNHNAFGSPFFPTKLRSSRDVTLMKSSGEFTLLHTGNYSTLLAGGTINGSITANSFIGQATAASLLRKTTSSNTWCVANGNALDIYNSNSTKRFWFGYSLPEGSPYATNEWFFGASDGTGVASGKVNAATFIGNLTGTADRALALSDYYGRRVSSANIVFADTRVRKLIATSAMTTAKPPTDGSILHFAWDNATGWNHQLFIACVGDAEPDKRMAWRAQRISEAWVDWKPIAFIDSNVASATKLATPRTIWGQSFDGTGNVSGDLKGLQNLIFADGYLGRKFSLTNSGGIFYQAPSSSGGWATNWSVKSNDGITSFGDLVGAFGVGDSLSYFYFGGEYNAPSIAIMPSGMIAIGGTTADAKLHVHGNGKFSGALTANSLTIGGVTITYDSANEALCINGNMYALGGITAGGAGISAYTSLEARVARLEQQLNIS